MKNVIEDKFDVAFVSQMALREKQIQQNYRPIIAVHKWFARRPGTLFRGLLLSEFGEGTLSDIFCKSNQLSNLRIGDPFMGGGTPLIEANRLGCDVLGFDINPMAHWIVQQELEHLDLDLYNKQGKDLIRLLQKQIGHLYKTQCGHCSQEVDVKYFLWVKQHQCPECESTFDLWPGMLLAKDIRHTTNIVVCKNCDHLNECANVMDCGNCSSCDTPITTTGNASRGKATCTSCSHVSKFHSNTPPAHRLFALEYHCDSCRPLHKGRFFKSPDNSDNEKVEESKIRAKRMKLRYVPNDSIPPGDETNRLLKWGYSKYRDMFNERQLVGLELSGRAINRIEETRVKNALATNLSDLLRYQNMLCRYDTMALKSLDVFAMHGFPVSLIQCESNLFGIQNVKGINVGSGGWNNILSKFIKAKSYCDAPFETIHVGKKKRVIHTHGEWIGDIRNGKHERDIDIRCVDSANEDIPDNSLDAVLTDPPYFGNVQYAELMDFCYVWLRKLIGSDKDAFSQTLTRRSNELTGNKTAGRGLPHFTEGLSNVFESMAKALKPNAPLTFTFHHNSLDAYAPVGVAILDSRLPCTTAIPCPAEMGGSIHISGTKSSIVDTIFVCRKGAKVQACPEPDLQLINSINKDIKNLKEGGHRATDGDLNCILNGQLTRLAINELYNGWDISVSVDERLTTFNRKLSNLVNLEYVKSKLVRDPSVIELSSQQHQLEITY